jgi:hypothetical protein
MNTLLNGVWAQIGYQNDGHLVHTDRRTGNHKISFRMWPDIASANKALGEGLGKIEWEEWEEFE